MISKKRWVIAAGVTALAALGLAACDGKEEAPAESALEKARSALPPAQAPKVAEGESGEIRYEGRTQAGDEFKAQIGGDVTVPAGFPEDLPMYPDSVPFSAMETGSGTTFLSVDSDAQPPQVYEFYKEKLPASDWTIESELNVAGQRVLTVVKDDRKAVVQIESTEKGTRVAFMLGQ
jgi:hypothetical protein